MFTSTTSLALTSVVTFLVLVWAVRGERALRSLRLFPARLRQQPGLRWTLAVLGAMLVLNALEMRLEPWLGSHLRLDFTPWAASLGATLPVRLQTDAMPWLTQLFTWAYITVFPLLPLVAVVAFQDRPGRRRFLRDLALIYAINYLVALPFYLTFPVREAWAGGAGIHFLIPSVYPGFNAQYRPMSGLDNSFPSLHSALSLSVFLLAARSGDRRLTMVTALGAMAIVTATFYLGVHWTTDAVAGAALAVAANAVAALVRRAERQRAEQRQGRTGVLPGESRQSVPTFRAPAFATQTKE